MYMEYNVKFSLQTVPDKIWLLCSPLYHLHHLHHHHRHCRYCMPQLMAMPLSLPLPHSTICISISKWYSLPVLNGLIWLCVWTQICIYANTYIVYSRASLHNNLYELCIKWFYTALINVWIFASMDIFRSFMTHKMWNIFADYAYTRFGSVSAKASGKWSNVERNTHLCSSNFILNVSFRGRERIHTVQE